MRHQKKFIVSGLFILTSACGGSSTDTQMIEPLQFKTLDTGQVQQTRTGTLEIVGEGTDALVFINGVETLLDVSDNEILSGDVFVYAESLDDGVLQAFSTISPTFGAFIFGSNNADDPSLGGAVLRIIPTDMPLSGLANFTGEHRSIISEPQEPGSKDPNQILYYTLGTASLDVDFETGMLSGDITDRIVVSASTNEIYTTSKAADIQLQETTPLQSAEFRENGSFAGVITGGELSIGNQQLGTVGTQEYVGLIGGEAGEEVAGITNMRHEPIYQNGLTVDSLFELGAFSAKTDP